MIPNNYECEGQIDLFQILAPEKKEPPIWLIEGQAVYLVKLGDIKEYQVTGKTYTCGLKDDDRGYYLKSERDGGNTVTNSQIGNWAFTTLAEARRLADENLKSLEYIAKEDIKIINTVAYRYIRESDQREMISFLCEIENDMAYIKEFMSYHHIVYDYKKAMKRFMKQQEFEYYALEQFEYTPELKNMYKCVKESGWNYTEAGCSYAAGHRRYVV